MKRKEWTVSGPLSPDDASVLEDVPFNLCDFAFFLSVMKSKIAHECVLSIVMDNMDLKLKEVHVEEVILNQSGKRAIRLDAWAMDSEQNRYNMEMQNDTEQDDVRKRARFYQGLIDTPILKAGKHTRYRHLPFTTVIFITQEDIFGKDHACYTFTEQCEEVAGLHLGDGTRKIFLNMTSKIGRPELVSLLQYMKKTSLDNPEIIEKDERLCRLDEVVQEVRESEEWEAVKMSILSIGIEKGRAEGLAEGRTAGLAEGRTAGLAEGRTAGLAEGRTQGLAEGRTAGRLEGFQEAIRGTVRICRKTGSSKPQTLKLLMEEFQLSAEDAGKWLEKYWD